MFLKKLTNEEKEAFLNIAVHTAKSNGIIEAKEYELLEEYCKEMGVAFFDPQRAIELDAALKSISSSSKEHKKIMLIELLAICHIDGNYDEKEQLFMSQVVNSIGLSDDDLDVANDLLLEYLEKVQLIYNMTIS